MPPKSSHRSFAPSSTLSGWCRILPQRRDVRRNQLQSRRRWNCHRRSGRIPSRLRWGKTALQLKSEGGQGSLLAGLPDRKYYAFSGYAADPKVMGQIAATILDPSQGTVWRGRHGQAACRSCNGFAQNRSPAPSRARRPGYVVANGALGQESIFQQVGIARGDAKAIKDSEASLLKGLLHSDGLRPAGQEPVEGGL